MIPVEIVEAEEFGMTVLYRGQVSEENFSKFKLVKSTDGVVRISDLLYKKAVPEFVESIEVAKVPGNSNEWLNALGWATGESGYWFHPSQFELGRTNSAFEYEQLPRLLESYARFVLARCDEQWQDGKRRDWYKAENVKPFVSSEK